MKRNVLMVAAIAMLCLFHWPDVFGQAVDMSQKVTLDTKRKSYKVVLEILEKQCGCFFAYNPALFQGERPTEKFEQCPFSEVLDRLLSPLSLGFKVEGQNILIFREAENKGASLQKKAILKGYVRDAETGEELIGAAVLVKGTTLGSTTNPYGFYALTLPEGSYTLQAVYLGYSTAEKTVALQGDISLDWALDTDAVELDEVTIVAKEDSLLNILTAQMGKEKLSIQTVRQVPTLAGESDVLKTLQLTPGVLTQGEGASNLFVRGGTADQNLILLDEAPVYNPSHLMGFFSAFNTDALKDVAFYRGGIPAHFGGRLSSVLDLRMKEGNNQRFSASGGIGTLASRLTLEGPIKKGQSSYILSARRTYADLFLKLSADEFTRQTAAYFYDFNAKVNARLGEKDRLYISGYFGRDVNSVRTLQYIIDWGNATGTVRWNHVFNNNLFSNTSAIFSDYDYRIDLSSSNALAGWKSNIRDVTIKQDYTWFHKPKSTLSFGFQSTYHHFRPGYPINEGATVEAVPESKALEHGVYISHEQELSGPITTEYGLRYSLYQLLGPATFNQFNEGGQFLGEEQAAPGIYQTFQGLEPRVSLRYRLGGNHSIKASYQRTRQYMHMLSNSALSYNLFDVWFPATAQTPPQTADQVSFGYYRNFPKKALEFSAETYVKRMRQQVDYRDHSRLIMNPYLEGELLGGDAEAYGFELQLKKTSGRLSGWVNYAYSRVFREIEGINNGERYVANHDQPHSINTVLNYQLTKRVALSANWVFQSGRPFTLPVQTFRFGDFNAPIYLERNTGRLPNFHRLDFSLTLKAKEKPGRKNDGYWVFSVYNAYNRLNAATAFISPELEDIDLISDKSKTGYYKLSIFGILPSITYNFKF